jgi:4-amino-4-deoxy-L-arabinose transferase-like glycosyltransferase
VSRSRTARGTSGALAAILVAAAALRFATLHLQSFWLDEAVTVQLLHHGFFDMLSKLPHSESTPPLYYVLAWVWARIFGFGEVGLRSLSAVAGLGTVAVMAACGRRTGGPKGAIAAAAIAAVNPFLVWYSQEARSYALVTFLCAASLLAFLHVLDDRANRRALGAWAALSALALSTHYFAGFLIGPELVWLAWRGRGEGPVLVATGAVVVVGAALAPLAIAQRNTGNTDFLTEGAFLDRLVQVPKQLLIGYGAPGQIGLGLVAGVALATLLAAGLLGGAGAARARKALALGTAAVAIPLLLAAAGLDYVLSRNLLVAWPPLALAAALGAVRLRTWGAVVLIAALAASLAAIVGVDADARYQRDNWRGAFHAATAGGQHPRVLIYFPISGHVPLSVYVPRAVELPPQGAPVREVDILDLPIRRANRGIVVPPLPTPPPLPGFRFVARKTTDTYTLARYEAAQPVVVTPPEALGDVFDRPSGVGLVP